jgi:hypothetical protein
MTLSIGAPPPNSAQEATSEDPGLRRELRSRLSAPNRWADQRGRSMANKSPEVHDPEWYLLDPRTRKWTTRCSRCGAVCFLPGAPDEFFGRAPLVYYFDPGTLTEDGLCEQCSATVR